jgi:predicted lipid-binding transport protein (Tim44 family)
MHDLINSMTDLASRVAWRPAVGALFVLSAMWHIPAIAEDKPVYRCPGNLYTDALSAKEARDKGCKTLDGAPITVIQSVAPRTTSGAARSAGGGGGEKVSADDQKARDSDARRILEAELRKEEEALNALQKAYNNGQPERQGDERNYQKYLDRVNELKAAVTRKEADVAALRRELAKFGQDK